MMKEVPVYFDKNCQMSYVFHENKRMYFPKGWESTQIREYYNRLLMEQDKDSPHCYETDSFYVQDGDSVADVGAAVLIERSGKHAENGRRIKNGSLRIP
jgi:hypothetical protein